MLCAKLLVALDLRLRVGRILKCAIRLSWRFRFEPRAALNLRSWQLQAARYRPVAFATSVLLELGPWLRQLMKQLLQRNQAAPGGLPLSIPIDFQPSLLRCRILASVVLDRLEPCRNERPQDERGRQEVLQHSRCFVLRFACRSCRSECRLGGAILSNSYAGVLVSHNREV